jgi:glycosyltransferase involved in cell wall biosynthesis
MYTSNITTHKGTFFNEDFMPLISKGDGCSYHRIELPFTYGGLDLEAAQGKSSEDFIERSKLITFNRNPGYDKGAWDAIKNLQKTKTIVYDMDDYEYLYTGHLLKRNWDITGKPQYYQSCYKQSDYVTCTTERLAQKIRSWNSNTFVIPNSIPFGYKQFSFVEKNITSVKFGYVGGSTHKMDLMTIKDVFQHFNQLDISLCGYDTKGFTNETEINNPWYHMERIVSNNGHNKNYKKVNSKSLETYMQCYNQINVALAPLADNTFNSCKSELKILEAGCARMPVIASNVPPYSDVKAEGVTLCRTIKEWKAAINKYKNNPELVKEDGEKLYQWVLKNRNMENVNYYRGLVYEWILEGKKTKDCITYEQFLETI